MFRAGGHWSVETYFSKIKDLHIGEGFDWSTCLERAFRKSKRAMNRGIGPFCQSASSISRHWFIARVLLCVIGVLWGFEI